MFRPLECTETAGAVRLSGQFTWLVSDCTLSVRLGRCLVKIILHCGKLRISHRGYAMLDGPSWCMRPVSKQPAYYDLNQPGEYEFDLIISMRTEMLERVLIVNKQLFAPAEFDYTVTYTE